MPDLEDTNLIDSIPAYKNPRLGNPGDRITANGQVFNLIDPLSIAVNVIPVAIFDNLQNYVLDATPCDGSTITVFDGQPDILRTLVLGLDNSLPTPQTVHIEGTDANDLPIEEDVLIPDSGNANFFTVNFYKTITSTTTPNDGGNNFYIGLGNRFPMTPVQPILGILFALRGNDPNTQVITTSVLFNSNPSYLEVTPNGVDEVFVYCLIANM